ncbi:helix-turn-helix domain-containing protein [Dyella caseinilytica]|uniref:Helix-turn-helix domain-containing protein n=1 Tax=Dyella caseinilytica TaxID=1849581 RepID=A0ABX7GZY5_9GAMM|nr:helix-turn-helix domain-containing protein [Dyella caseinilytica]QRN55389.1 helix-turn-helix domain-containing protein [Dyella caseinilytica]GGA01344.1 hypothetical protein GCM10011408_23280 [Dyella caseinilytica]
MSNAVMNACWPLQMPPTPKAVLISLADNASDKGACFPSLTKICERTCFGKTAVIEAIKWLEAHGVVKADRSNRYKTSYTVTPDLFTPNGLVLDTNQSATRTSLDDGGLVRLAVNEVRETVNEVRQADTNHQEPSLTLNKSNHQRKRTPDMSGTRFDEFWNAYPTKTEKRQCAEKWIADGLDEHVDLMLADIAAKSERDRRWLDGYVPNALTYLNQERWNDPVQPVNRRPSVTDQFTKTSYESSSDEELPESLRSPA